MVWILFKLYMIYMILVPILKSETVSFVLEPYLPLTNEKIIKTKFFLIGWCLNTITVWFTAHG